MRELFRIRGFMPYVAMLFLNAFVDLGHKIVIQNTVFKIYDGTTQSALMESMIDREVMTEMQRQQMLRGEDTMKPQTN